MLTPARPLDITHTVDRDSVDHLLSRIKEDPPILPVHQSDPNEPIQVESEEV